MLAVTLALLAPGLGDVGHAQGAPDLNALALDWSRGRYLSPIICEVDGELVSGGRRIMVAPGPRHLRPSVNQVQLSDLNVKGASRCFNELGSSEPNVMGRVQFRLEGRPHPDTAPRDFKAAIRREHGFSFHIPEGRLRVQEVAPRRAARSIFGVGRCGFPRSRQAATPRTG